MKIPASSPWPNHAERGGAVAGRASEQKEKRYSDECRRSETYKLPFGKPKQHFGFYFRQILWNGYIRQFIKPPYYYFVFESDSACWTYKIDAVLGVIMDKTCDKIIPLAPEFIGLEKAKQIALEDTGLDEATQKIVFTREELSRNSGKPCYILEFYTDKCAYSYKVDAVSGDILEKNIEWRSLQESEPVSETVQSSDSNQRRIG